MPCSLAGPPSRTSLTSSPPRYRDCNRCTLVAGIASTRRPMSRQQRSSIGSVSRRAAANDRSSFSSVPARITVTDTLSPARWPSNPRSMSSGRATGVSPMCVITSPAFTPTLSAGLCRRTASTITPRGPSLRDTMPCHVRSTRSTVSSAATTSSTLSTGMAKPIPCAPARTATLMPTISPSMLSSGPPELPGLMLASVWIRSSYRCVRLTSTSRWRADTMPRVTVCS